MPMKEKTLINLRNFFWCFRTMFNLCKRAVRPKVWVLRFQDPKDMRSRRSQKRQDWISGDQRPRGHKDGRPMRSEAKDYRGPKDQTTGWSENLKPNSWTHNFVGVSGHNLRSSQICGFRIQCLHCKPDSNHFCSGGGGGGGLKNRECCLLLMKKNKKY